MMGKIMSEKHFILVHGANHGAWCWYKLVTLLRAAGHRVTAPDLAACGIDTKPIGELNSISEHSQPLMEIMASLPQGEKVILVAHSRGGSSVALAMEKFPEKISVAVFVTAFMPNPASPPSYLLQQIEIQMKPQESLMDCQFSFDRGTENRPTAMNLGHKYMSSNLYNCSSQEDLTLATMLARPCPLFEGDVTCESLITEEKSGSVNRVYIISKEDKVLAESLQRWMIENYPVKEVREIEGSDHMVMLSKPQELCHHLLEISKKYPYN